MSKSGKARYGMKTKYWKDTVGRSASQARSRAKWKKAKKNTKTPTFGNMRKTGNCKPDCLKEEVYWLLDDRAQYMMPL